MPGATQVQQGGISRRAGITPPIIERRPLNYWVSVYLSMAWLRQAGLI